MIGHVLSASCTGSVSIINPFETDRPPQQNLMSGSNSGLSINVKHPMY